MRPERADLRPEKANSRSRRADLRLERADFRPEKANSRSRRTDLRPQKFFSTAMFKLGELILSLWFGVVLSMYNPWQKKSKIFPRAPFF